MASETLAQKALAYGMPTVRVDGNDIYAVHYAAKQAVARARAGQGPSFIECVTYRLGDHTTADDARRYRDEAEVEAWRSRDPLIRVRKHLTNKKAWDDARDEELQERARKIVAEVVDAAINIQPPATTDFFDWMYADLPDDLRLQRATMRTSSLGQHPEQVGLKVEAMGNRH
jgi:pyruvate dehydrogenase E1 component alpha subunit